MKRSGAWVRPVCLVPFFVFLRTRVQRRASVLWELQHVPILPKSTGD
uniref:Uncharacterized protein n=1 Tax=Anguilla anguilla TaxID=7936 RepID=A0A0E9XA30_ANGAN